MNIRKTFQLTLLLAFITLGAKAQTPTQILEEMGFENVTATLANDTVYAEFEDSRYRGTFRGAAKALQALKDKMPEAKNYEMVVLEDMVPKIALHASCADENWDVDVDYKTNSVKKHLTGKQTEREYFRKSSSYGKVDVNLYPLVSLTNNEFTQLYRYGICFAPSIETSLWWGGRITIQPIIPVKNNFKQTSLKRKFQWGSFNIQQDIIDNGKYWARVGAGTFRTNRIGFMLNTGVKLNNNLDLSLVANWSAASANLGHKWHFGRAYGRYAHMKLDWFEPTTLLQVQLSAGQFLYGDVGTRLDVTRHFGEYAIGLYGIYTKGKDSEWTDGEHNAGFHFTIPFGGKSQYRKGYVRVKLPEYFNWEYGMVSYYKYHDDSMGYSLMERPNDNHSARYWQAEYVKRNVLRVLNGED